ncbi:Asparaginase/glutaminase [Candidatus Magnetomorum sp. HK-1]|nr:Asparaginase/glutaminase [Candidatus Magnetomorum sp. HK-1]
MKSTSILLITTGGTIAGNVADSKTGATEKHSSGEDFKEIIEPTLNHFKNKWQVEVKISHELICDEDSSDIVPKNWIDLVDIIVKNYDEFDSFIITHGTNTMSYTCAALSFAIANLNKPVIVTGSQVPSGLPGSDALTNLTNALRVAIWPYEPTVKGVVAVFGCHIITGTRLKKTTEFDYEAFQPFSSSSIGRIGRIIIIDEYNLKKHLNYLKTANYNKALIAEDLKVENDFDMRIVSITEFPGMSHEIFKSLVENNDIKGFILRAFGAGDASTHIHPGLKYLKEKEIPIVITTQAPNGNSNFQVNKPGQYIANGDLAIPAYDMSIESQTTKLAWLLAKKKKGEITYEDIKREMNEDIRGEINKLKEFKQ